MPKKEQVIGNKYHSLTIVEEVPPTYKYTRRFKCLCDCGNYAVIQLSNLKIGHTKSCGCKTKQMVGMANKTHGMSHTTEYKSYRKMIERCFYEKDINYHNYGGRGITVCDRWLESFDNFFEDMGYKPTLKHSIERENTNGNYEPYNCVWATKKVQNNNRTDNTRYQYDGLDMTQSQWAEYLKIPYGKIIDHLKRGVSFEEIVEYVNKNPGKNLRFKPIVRKYYPRKNK